MGINGVSSYANTYTYGNVKNENVKPSKNSEKNYYAGYTMNSANKFKNVSDYSKYLTNKYKCLTPCKNASVKSLFSSVLRSGNQDMHKYCEFLFEKIGFIV